jgi:anti-sigma factor RsiW
LSRTEPHNEFLELCAVSTSGQLTVEEQKKLQEHLAGCESCRETLKQYESVVDQAIPAFVAKEASNGLDEGPEWSEDQQRQAEQAIFERLEGTHRGEHKKSINTSGSFYHPPSSSPIFQ